MILFKRVPILRAMFFEVILSQCLSSVLNFHFMVKVKETILDDEERAGWTGSVSLNTQTLQHACRCDMNVLTFWLATVLRVGEWYQWSHAIPRSSCCYEKNWPLLALDLHAVNHVATDNTAAVRLWSFTEVDCVHISHHENHGIFTSRASERNGFCVVGLWE